MLQSLPLKIGSIEKQGGMAIFCAMVKNPSVLIKTQIYTNLVILKKNDPYLTMFFKLNFFLQWLERCNYILSRIESSY